MTSAREFAANHPEASADVAELAIAGFDNHLYYSWPMSRLIIEASRLTAVHAATAGATTRRRRFPSARITAIRLAHGTAVEHERDPAGRARRARRTRHSGRGCAYLACSAA